jgi:hypothetical protein
MTRADIDFQQIAPRCGGKRQAFEELCCQLAHRRAPDGSSFSRLNGAGGDGGVECFVDLPDGRRVGWQAKYVFDIGSLLRQATKSLDVAMQVHPNLAHYILCFPFDLTGRTRRRGQSDVDKIAAWRRKQTQKAVDQGRVLEIEEWPAATLRSLLLDIDVSGGIRTYFFNDTILSSEWFVAHLTAVNATAGPRYTSRLNVLTDVSRWYSAFGRTLEWRKELALKLREAQNNLKRLREAATRTSKDPALPKWPEALREEAYSVAEAMLKALNACSTLGESDHPGAAHQRRNMLLDVVSSLSVLETKLVVDFEKQHGRVDSPGFRQFMAEYQISLVGANLDSAREALAALRDLYDWLGAPAGALAFTKAFVLTGGWGVGKTHTVCDVASHRLAQQLLSCVVFGHQFGGEPDPWTRLAESLGLPITIGKDGLLDALDAAGEATGHPLIIFIDAINETRPLEFWRTRIGALVEEVRRRPSLRICFTCRTPYLDYCLPEAHDLSIVEHSGFKGVEQVACTAFFKYYGLKPPVAPILQPELANPLYLRLVCETIRANGMDRLPTGWSSTAQVITALLEAREREVGREKSISSGARIVTSSLRGIARAIAESGRSRLNWSEATRIVRETHAEAGTLGVVEWLVRANLLIEEAPDSGVGFYAESTIRPAFERLGDFLIASELLTQASEAPLESAFDVGGKLYSWVQDQRAIEEGYGVLSALSILIPEREAGRELPDLVASGEVRDVLAEIALTSIPWRDASSFSSASRELVLEALRKHGLSEVAMDRILSITWRPSAVDATWLHELLERFPLARRDAYWCGYLNRSYDQSGPVRRLIDAAFELPLGELDHDVAVRWSIVLTWFTAAADRRVKDRATRALTKILIANPALIPELLAHFLWIDDDEVRERLLLSGYGALIISRDKNITERVIDTLHRAFREAPQDFDNALIRDHIRCIGELVYKLGSGSREYDSLLTMQPIQSEWPLKIPSFNKIEHWGDLLHFGMPDFFSDFFRYSMGCLSSWEHALSRRDMAKWIIQRVARDYGYEGSGCEDYDSYMLHKYGGGRGKPTWAERIGKKYQWLAMRQLASRLHDHADRERSSWEPSLLNTPLILLEERKLDPTLLAELPEAGRATSWWITESMVLNPTKHYSDEEWVVREEDIPALKELLSVVEHNGQNWRLLVSYPELGRRPEDAEVDEPYRRVWMHIHSYLVKRENFATACGCLYRRNFFGSWLPRGATWSYGFLGEYPWAIPFNTETEEWHGRGSAADLPVAFQPSWNHIAVEWEYDASLERNFHMLVPARIFFSPSNLWWNGQDGYRLIEGRTVFRDPSITAIGPTSLLVDEDDLVERLNLLGLRIVWTLLGEKLIIGRPHGRKIPRRTFSQIASLSEDGSLRVGERVFFDDYRQDAGPLVVEARPNRSGIRRRRKGAKNRPVATLDTDKLSLETKLRIIAEAKELGVEEDAPIALDKLSPDLKATIIAELGEVEREDSGGK